MAWTNTVLKWKYSKVKGLLLMKDNAGFVRPLVMVLFPAHRNISRNGSIFFRFSFETPTNGYDIQTEKPNPATTLNLKPDLKLP